MEKYTEVLTSQMLTGALEHFKVATPASIEITADKETATDDYYEQARVLESIIEIFRVRGNVVIVGPVDASGFSVAVEKADAVDPAEIETKIQEQGTVPFGGTTVDLSGVTVVEVPYKLA